MMTYYATCIKQLSRLKIHFKFWTRDFLGCICVLRVDKVTFSIR